MITPTTRRFALLLIVLFAIVLSPGHSIDVSDPFNGVYRALEQWREKGYISNLPNLKPYPLQLMESLLNRIVSSAPEPEAERARRYLRSIDSGITLGAKASERLYTTGESYLNVSAGYLTANTFLSKHVSVSGKAGILGVVEPGGRESLPPGTSPITNYYVDITPEVGNATLAPSIAVTGITAVGTDQLWVQGGVTRHSFGPSFESPVLSPYATASGHFSFTWRQEDFVYSNFLLPLTATRDDGTAIGSNGAVEVFPNKYLAGHSFQFSPWPWLSWSVWETVIFGERFDPMYLLPIVSKIYNSVYNGKTENALFGGSATLSFPHDLSWNTMLFVDDFHFEDFIALNWDTRYKLAVQSSIAWTPLHDLLQRVSLQYNLVMPYMYTHRREAIRGIENITQGGFDEYNSINYLNYTHRGRSLASLAPNSDRLQLRTQLAVSPRLDLTFLGQLQRHANATGRDYVPAWYVGTSDGSVFDNGYTRKADEHRFDSVRFLSQDVIERLILVSARVDYRFPFLNGSASVDGSYSFEYGWNRQGPDPKPTAGNWENGTVPIAGNDGATHYVELGLTYSY